MNRPEQALQIQIIEWLRLMETRSKKPFIFFHPANGGFRTPREAVIFKRMGVVAGVADIVIANEDCLAFIEVKAKKGSLSKNQKAFQNKCLNAKIKYYIVKSLDEFMDLFKILNF